MNKITTTLAGVVLTLGLAGCGVSDTPEPAASSSEVTTTTSKTTTTTTTSQATTTSKESATQPATEEAIAEQAPIEPAPIVEETSPDPAVVADQSAVAPPVPPMLRPEDYDPYGPPKFVQCWEPNAALMSDGSIVADTVNCFNDDPAWGPPQPQAGAYEEDPYRADGCVGPAAVCGYYDEYGNPIWFDKLTGESSPRYYDEYGNPTMQRP